MAAAGAGESYYCHMCETEIVPNLQDFTCPSCHSGFIEALPPSDSLRTTPSELSVFQLLQQLMGGNAGRLLTAESVENDSSSDEDEVDPDEIYRSSRRSARNSNRRSTRERVFRRDLNGRSGISARVQLSGVDYPIRIPFLSDLGAIDGDFQSYVFNRPMFNNFIAILMNELQVGPPPASESAIADLPVTTLTEEQALKLGICSICFDDFKPEEIATHLPCSHVYHQSCVTTWLKQHGTCPVCRKDLAGQDTSRLEDPGPILPGASEGSGSSYP